MGFPHFIGIRNEAQQRKPIHHHFHVGRTGNEWLLRTPFIRAYAVLCIYLWCFLKCTTAPLLVMNQDTSLQIRWDSDSVRKMNCSIRLLRQCSRDWGRWRRWTYSAQIWTLFFPLALCSFPTDNYIYLNNPLWMAALIILRKKSSLVDTSETRDITERDEKYFQSWPKSSLVDAFFSAAVTN